MQGEFRLAEVVGPCVMVLDHGRALVGGSQGLPKTLPELTNGLGLLGKLGQEVRDRFLRVAGSHQPLAGRV